MTYFACFGYAGLIGLFFSCALIAFCGAKALLIVKENNIEGPHALNKKIGGKIGGRLLTLCCGFFSFFAYVVVLSGMKQICNESLIPVIIATVCAYIVLYRGFTTMANICGVFAPLLAGIIAVITLAGAFSGFGDNVTKTENYASFDFMPVKIFLYAGYNVLTSLCVLGRAKDLLTRKRNAVLGGISCGIMLFVSGAAILCGMVYSKISPYAYEMPVLALFGSKSIIIEIIVFTTMFLSAVTGLTGTCVFFEEYLPQRQFGVFVALAAVPLTYISFGQLLDFIYPVFGFVGIFLMIILALLGSKKV
ncbi:MAG: hypothetical protein E7387_01765 [Ruminococcaceae bacterium]|nr:hypothetical protein [Oscillospiraceae bacterium]